MTRFSISQTRIYFKCYSAVGGILWFSKKTFVDSSLHQMQAKLFIFLWREYLLSVFLVVCTDKNSISNNQRIIFIVPTSLELACATVIKSASKNRGRYKLYSTMVVIHLESNPFYNTGFAYTGVISVARLPVYGRLVFKHLLTRAPSCRPFWRC